MKQEQRSYRKYSKAEKQVHVKRFRESGMTLYSYSKSVGLEPNVIRYWLKKETVSSTELVSCSCEKKGVSVGECSNNKVSAANTSAANASIGSCGVFPSDSIVFNAAQEETPMKEEKRDLEAENRLLEKELAEIKLKLKETEERAYQAELKSFVLDTLIEVADETYGLDLKKNIGSKR